MSIVSDFWLDDKLFVSISWKSSASTSTDREVA